MGLPRPGKLQAEDHTLARTLVRLDKGGSLFPRSEQKASDKSKARALRAVHGLEALEETYLPKGRFTLLDVFIAKEFDEHSLPKPGGRKVW